MIVYPNSTESYAHREAGGKGYALYTASRLGFPVPRWAIVGRSEFTRFSRDTGIENSTNDVLLHLKKGGDSPGEAAGRIETLFRNAPHTQRLEAEVLKAYHSVGLDKVIAVRSSAASEDGAVYSFAGQLSSFLFVEGIERALAHVIECFASVFSERCLTYRLENNLLSQSFEVAVILQEMIFSEVSGVLFTCNPVTHATDEFVISSTYGVGEGLVSGLLPADTFWVDRKTGALLSSSIVSKPTLLSGTRTGSSLQDVPLSRQSTPSLSDEHIAQLTALGERILGEFPRPQDIEWAYKDEVLYLLQTRPVTSLPYETSGFPNLWDNSNIVESYGGVTLPLSFTFALNNYRLVYHQFCEVLGVPHRIIREMDHYLRNMLGCIDGRVYYNLYNWYKLVGILPGFSKNREFMETMMGVKEALPDEVQGRITPHPSWQTWRGMIRKVKIGFNFVLHHFTIQGTVKRFLTDFDTTYQHFRSIEYGRLAGDRVFQHYLSMEQKMMAEWKAPIINDFLCMVHFGLLKKLTEMWFSEDQKHLHNDLLRADGTFESAEPTRQLLKLASVARQNAELKTLLTQFPSHELLERLCQSPHQDFYNEILRYLDRFGHRCMNEMKLEEIDLLSDPSYLFTCLKNYLAGSELTSSDQLEQRERLSRTHAEQQIHQTLSGVRKTVYVWVLFHARRAVRNRENTRFARTRAYGVARSMFQAIGKDLALLQVLEHERDIFYLTLEEVYGIYQGTLTSYSLREIIDLRKNQYAEFLSREPSSRFLTRGAVYWKNSFETPTKPLSSEIEGDWDLRGIPCCPGIVEGIVKVVSSAQEDLSLKGEILVTPRTDPGWVPLYPSAGGLLVERGSLLSHSAIVAREMGLPAIVGIDGLIKTLRTGMRIRMDSSLGTVKILD